MIKLKLHFVFCFLFLFRVPQKWCALPQFIISGYQKFILLLLVVNCEHLAKVVFAMFLYSEVIIFSIVINKYWEACEILLDYQISCFSSPSHPQPSVILVSSCGSCLQQLWLWYSNGNFLFNCFLRWEILEYIWMVMRWVDGGEVGEPVKRPSEKNAWKREPELAERFPFDERKPQILH